MNEILTKQTWKEITGFAKQDMDLMFNYYYKENYKQAHKDRAMTKHDTATTWADCRSIQVLNSTTYNE